MWLALVHKEVEEQRGFWALLLGGSVLLEAYAAIRVPEHMGAALVAFLPLWGILLLIPFRFAQSMAMERRGQTMHLLHSLPVSLSVPLVSKLAVFLVGGIVTTGVALGGIYLVYGQVESVLRFPGVPQVSGEQVLAFSGLGTMSAMVLLTGVTTASEGVRTSLHRLRWLGAGAFLLGTFLAYVFLLSDGVQVFTAAPIFGDGMGHSFFAYTFSFGLCWGAIGVFLFQRCSEV